MIQQTLKKEAEMMWYSRNSPEDKQISLRHCEAEIGQTSKAIKL